MNKLVTKVFGSVVSIADLPLPHAHIRWTFSRKRIVVAAVEGGLITIADCKKRWGISEEELGWWRNQFTTHGDQGLKVTKCQDYR